jgi:hypothetical protein
MQQSEERLRVEWAQRLSEREAELVQQHQQQHLAEREARAVERNAEEVRRPLRAFRRPVLAGISLCDMCSCHEILRAQRTRVAAAGAGARRGGGARGDGGAAARGGGGGARGWGGGGHQGGRGGGDAGPQAGESFPRWDWVAVPEALRARRVNKQDEMQREREEMSRCGVRCVLFWQPC